MSVISTNGIPNPYYVPGQVAPSNDPAGIAFEMNQRASNPSSLPYNSGGTGNLSPAALQINNSNMTPAQQQAAFAALYKAGGTYSPSQPVSTTMNADRVGSTNPLQLPPPSYQTPPNSFVSSLPDSSTQTSGTDTTASTAAKPSWKDQFFSKYTDVLNKLGGEGSAYKSLQDQYQVPQLAQELAGVRGTIAQRRAAYLSQWQTAENQAIPTPFIAGEQTQIQRTQAVEMGVLTAQEQALTGNLQAANDIIDKTIEHEFEPLKTQLTGMAQFFNMNQNDLSDSERLALQNKYDVTKFNAEQLFTAKKDWYGYAVSANASPAAVSELTNASSVADLANVGLKYGFGPAKYTPATNPYTGEMTSFNTFTGQFGKGGSNNTPAPDNGITTPQVNLQIRPAVGEIAGQQYIDMGKLTPNQVTLAQRESQRTGIPLLTKEDANKLQDAETTYESASGLVKTISNSINKLITANNSGEAIGQGLWLKGKSVIPGTEANVFSKTVNAFSSLITRAAGEKGVLTTQDVTRIINALPGFYDTKKSAAEKAAQLNTILQSTFNGSLKAYLGGKSATTPQNTQGESFGINGLQVTLPNGKVWTAPNQNALNSFKKDYGLQ